MRIATLKDDTNAVNARTELFLYYESKDPDRGKAHLDTASQLLSLKKYTKGLADINRCYGREYESMLNDYGFYRVHQSTIVSLRYVVAFKKADDGYLEMSDGVIVKVSRSKQQGLIDKFH